MSEGRRKWIRLATVKKSLTVQLPTSKRQFSCQALLNNCHIAQTFAELSTMIPDSGGADSHFVFRLVVGTASPQCLLAPLSPKRGEGSKNKSKNEDQHE